MEEGTITGDGTGWLIHDEVYQNVAVFTRFRCDGPCHAGGLLRASETETGLSGVLVAIENESVVPYRVTMDAEGHFLTKISIQDPPRAPAGGPEPASPVIERARAMLTAPVYAAADTWNTLELFVDANTVSNHLNNVRNAIPGGTIEDLPPLPPAEFGGAVVPPDTTVYGYGRIALYVGAGRVAFDDVAVKDLNAHRSEPERTSDRFRVQRVNDFYYAWGADVADIDNDDVPDLISGPFYYLGPDFHTRHAFYRPRVFNPGLEYVNDMLTFANDWTGDGWTDVVVTERRPLVMYVWTATWTPTTTARPSSTGIVPSATPTHRAASDSSRS